MFWQGWYYQKVYELITEFCRFCMEIFDGPRSMMPRLDFNDSHHLARMEKASNRNPFRTFRTKKTLKVKNPVRETQMGGGWGQEGTGSWWRGVETKEDLDICNILRMPLLIPILCQQWLTCEVWAGLILSWDLQIQWSTIWFSAGECRTFWTVSRYSYCMGQFYAALFWISNHVLGNPTDPHLLIPNLTIFLKSNHSALRQRWQFFSESCIQSSGQFGTQLSQFPTDFMGAAFTLQMGGSSQSSVCFIQFWTRLISMIPNIIAAVSLLDQNWLVVWSITYSSICQDTDSHPNWEIFFQRVETTHQKSVNCQTAACSQVITVSAIFGNILVPGTDRLLW